MDEELRAACAGYIADTFAPEDALLRDLRRDIAASGMPEIYISPDEGRLLQVLLRLAGARRVVELGTLGGYSTIWIGRALPADGRLVSIERDPSRAELARRYLRRAELVGRCEIRVGEAHAALAELRDEEPFDAIFIDADKASYPDYLEWSVENLEPGGLVIGDNALLDGRVLDADSGDADVRGMRAFNRRLADDNRFTSIIVPTRDGVAIGRLNRA